MKKWIMCWDWEKWEMDATLNRIFWEAITAVFFFFSINLLKPGLMINGNYKCAKKDKNEKKTELDQC